MTKKQSKKKRNCSQKNGLLSTIKTNFSASALIILCCFIYLGLIKLPEMNTIGATAQAQTLADSQVSLLDQALAQLRLRLGSISNTKDLLNALQMQDDARIQQYKNELIRAFPEAVSVRIISLGPLGIAALDKQAIKLNNNIELDLIRHASNGDTIEPEAYKIHDRWLFSVAEPVKSSNRKYADGALLLTLDEGFLNMLLSQLDNSLGHTQLFQQFKNDQQLITSTGSSKTNKLTVSTDASISNWSLRFTPSQELIASSHQSAWIAWILLAIAAAALLFSALFTYSTLRKLLAKELTCLIKGNSNAKPFLLPGFQATANHIQTLVTEKRTKPAGNTNKPVEQPAIAPQPREPQDLAPTPTPTTTAVENTQSLPTTLPETIFRAYDIRGLAEEELTNELVFAIGLAIGSEALDQGQQSLIVSADGRHSSPRIRDALVKGILASGRDVIDIGMMPTPMMYFATHQLETQSGVMITGSHNTAEYNGIKMVICGKSLSGTEILSLRNRIINKEISSGQGQYRSQNIEDAYIDYIVNDVAIAQPLKIVIDAGNGVAGAIAPRLFEELGCEVIPLYCDVDGDFPNHHPDPSIADNLKDLIQTVVEQQADLGIAFDGDGDRLAAVSASGKAIPADRLLMLLAQDVVSRNPGADIIFDVKCTRSLNTLISNYGGRPIMWKSGHSFMKEKMKETGALLAGEYSGHIFFKERWFGFDDGMYAAARLIEILSTSDPDLDNQIAVFPESLSTPEIKITSTDTQKFHIIEQLSNENNFGNGKISTLDGLRVDFIDGWGLVRASNTTPMLTLRFEADNPEAMDRIQSLFKNQLSNIDSQLDFSQM